MLKKGDIIYCKKVLGTGLTLNKPYKVVNTRQESIFNENDICIIDDFGGYWWFGQIGETECWTNWFITEKEFTRDIILKELGI